MMIPPMSSSTSCWSDVFPLLRMPDSCTRARCSFRRSDWSNGSAGECSSHLVLGGGGGGGGQWSVVVVLAAEPGLVQSLFCIRTPKTSSTNTTTTPTPTNTPTHTQQTPNKTQNKTQNKQQQTQQQTIISKQMCKHMSPLMCAWWLYN